MMHTCREVAELEYGRQLVESLKDDPLIGETWSATSSSILSDHHAGRLPPYGAGDG